MHRETILKVEAPPVETPPKRGAYPSKYMP